MHSLACLDLFAGSGAMGFEAMSRGAAKVVMIESNSAAHRALLENAALLKAERAQILHVDAMKFLDQDSQRYDVVFLDPPYGQKWLEKLLPIMHSHLAQGGLVYAEAEKPLTDDGQWTVHKRGKAGNVFYHLLKCLEPVSTENERCV